MPLFSRSARTFIQRRRGEPLHIKHLQTLGCSVVQDAIDIKVLQTLGMARETRSPARVETCEGPRPPVNGDDFLFLTVERGPVPRALSTFAENARSPETTDGYCSDWRMARDRFSHRPTVKAAIKHGEGQALALRKGRRFFIVARGPVRRDVG